MNFEFESHYVKLPDVCVFIDDLGKNLYKNVIDVTNKVIYFLLLHITYQIACPNKKVTVLNLAK